ncbi:galactosyltransferase-related protein [Sphingomonas bacterium]|uniref:galactosyltransferase-related protein n=1 Tax=Sphingomonas bacterium TaxID=1895847 RepID=UPI0020C5F312|nr:galactosyltransferase-related protein [Sphingomonas bacterium]
MSLSICTIGHGRADHLLNLIEGLRRQVLPPAEIVIAVMQDDPYDLPDAGFPVRQIMMDDRGLALAAARNAAAQAATSDKIAFLDIDCIPAPDFVADYTSLLDRGEALLMGEMLYLPAGATQDGIDYDRFAGTAVLHSERAGPPDDMIGECSDYRCFWSLNFAMHRAAFDRVGGFDERYRGYGGEDTDFGRVVSISGLPIRWCRGALAYHQYHPHHMPPVHHIDSVIANATLFAEKWGHYTMEHWLQCFELMGLVRMDGPRPVRVREVTEDDLALTRQQAHEPYASAATVFRLLTGRAAMAAA